MQNAHEVITHIIKGLFVAEDRRIQSWIDKLARKNKEIEGFPEPMGFLFNGSYYRTTLQGRSTPPKKALHWSLTNEMESFLKDKQLVDNDRQYIFQTLFNLLHPCKTEQDVRDVLPECLITAFPNLVRTHNRTREPAFTIQDDERALRQYEKILPKIKFYATARLIY